MGNTERKRVNPGDRRTSAMTENYKEIDATRTNANPLTMLQRKQNDLKVVSDEIKNREPFSYNINGDALYDQYKDQYKQRAEAASSDAIGKASAMTGGYGNSYAQMLGQQAYANEMANFGQMENQLYQAAMDRYDRETKQLYDKYDMLSGEVDKEMAHEQALADAEVQKAKYTADQHQTYAGTLDWMVEQGYITEEEADALFAKSNGKDPDNTPDTPPVYDANAVPVDNPETGKKTWNGYEVVEDNKNHKLFGRIFGTADENLNRNAKIKAPDGNTYTIAEYYRYLKNEKNYSEEKAREKVLEIQNALGLSD